MAKGDLINSGSKDQSRYSSSDSENSDSPGMGRVNDPIQPLDIRMKNRQGRDVQDHTTTHRAPGDD